MRRRLIAIVTAALLAAALATTLGTTPSTASGSTPSGAAAATPVKLTLEVKNCGTCELWLVQYDDTDPQSYWTSKRKTVKKGKVGKVAFKVLPERTHGVSIAIDAPWATAIVRGTDYVGVRFDGFETGDPVTKAQVLSATQGSRCWSGTDRDRKITVKVAKRTYGPGTDTALRAWASPTLDSTNMVDTFEGSFVTTHPHCPPPA